MTGDGRALSVVIPAYQAARFIGEAIESVLSQDPPPTEVLVIDDGSTDGTPDVVGGFGDRVTLIRQPNGGEAAARNTGLREAACDRVAYLDADDRFLPGRIGALRSALAADPTMDVVTTDALLTASGVTVRRCYEDDWPFEHDDQRAEILRRNFVFGHVVVDRGRLVGLGGFDETIGHAADWDMWVRLLLAGGRIGLVPEPLSVYRLHAGSMSADRVAMERGCLATLERALGNPDLRPHERLIAESTQRSHRLRLERERLSASVLARADVRASALAVVRNRDQPGRARAKAAASALAPSLVSRLVGRRHRGLVTGTTGRLVRAELGDDTT